MQFGVMDKEKFQAARAMGLAHLHFSIELYNAQCDDGRYFVHEHPDGATSWSDARVVDLIARDGVWWTRNDQCELGQTAIGRDGRELPAQQPTGWITNSRKIAE